MAKRVLFTIYLCLQTLLLCGYVSRPVTVRPVVTKVDVYYMLDGKPGHLHLTDQEKMTAVLGCLRAADSHIIAENQHPTGDFSCTVRVCLANGEYQIYRQVSDTYFSKYPGAWKIINPKQGTRLFSLICALKTNGFQGASVYQKTCFWKAGRSHESRKDKNSLPAACGGFLSTLNNEGSTFIILRPLGACNGPADPIPAKAISAWRRRSSPLDRDRWR